MFKSQAAIGFFSPVALSMAASDTQRGTGLPPTPCEPPPRRWRQGAKTAAHDPLIIRHADVGNIHIAHTVLSLSASTSSMPSCPAAPMTRILAMIERRYAPLFILEDERRLPAIFVTLFKNSMHADGETTHTSFLIRPSQSIR